MTRDNALKIILDYCKDYIEDWDARSSIAFTHMGNWRCPLYHADASLFDDILNAIEDCANDYEFDADEYDPDEIIWMED